MLAPLSVCVYVVLGVRECECVCVCVSVCLSVCLSVCHSLFSSCLTPADPSNPSYSPFSTPVIHLHGSLLDLSIISESHSSLLLLLCSTVLRLGLTGHTARWGRVAVPQ